MKLFLPFLLITSCISAQERPKEFEVTFLINSSMKGQKVYLNYQYADFLGGITTDSQYVSANKVVFKGIICQPATAQLYTSYKLPTSIIELLPTGVSLDMAEGKLNNYFEFFLVPGKTTITSDEDIENSSITGPPGVSDFVFLNRASLFQDSVLMDLFPKMIRSLKKGDTIGALEFKAKADFERSKLRTTFFNYCKDNPESPIALYALRKSISPKLDSPEVYLKLLSKLSAKLRKYPEAKALKGILENIPASYVGKYVKNFDQLDTTGNVVSFSSFKGKYVLLYFWRSFSYVEFNIHKDMLPLWNKYQNKNFTIISIGLETIQSKSKWQKVIEIYQTPWLQLTDFKGVENKAAHQLGIANVPYNLLVNPDGQIIFRNGNPAELEAILNKELK